MTTSQATKAPPKLPMATVTKRIEITHDLWRMWLKPEVSFTFKPGQYTTIGVDGLERAYSIVSSPLESEIELFIELVPPPDGNLTPILHRLCVGNKVSIRPRAKGIFVMQEKYRDHLMMATVTGVVPYVSILRTYLQQKREGHRFIVIHGASYQDELAFDGELGELARAHPDFITYIPTISRPNDPRNVGWTGETGRANALVEKYVQKFGLKAADTMIYACGHPGMIEDVKARSAKAGFPFLEERFWKDDE